MNGKLALCLVCFIGLSRPADPAQACGRKGQLEPIQETSIGPQVIQPAATGWGWPINLGPTINTELDECRPSITAGGDTLFFQAEFDSLTGIDIWMSIRKGSEWGSPRKLGPQVNTVYDESKPYISPDGWTLYFVSSRPFGHGGMDIYASVLGDSGWNPSLPLDSPINTSYDEGAVSLSFDGKRLYFQSNRPGGYGNYDLWVSRKIGNDWGTPANLGPRINTSSLEWFALENPDSTRLYITQERPGGYGNLDLWSVDRDGESWSLPTNAGLPLNYYVNCSPTMTADGRTLYFGGGHFGEGYGALDIWMSIYNEIAADTLNPPVRTVTSSGWERTADLPGAEVVFSLVENDSGAILAGTYPGGRIYRTADEGETWTLADSMPGAISVFSLLKTRAGTILAGTFPNGDVFRSTDGGKTWQPTGELEDATEVHCMIEAEDGTIWSGTAPYGDVFVSTDDGRTWMVTGDLPGTEAVITLLESVNGTLFAGTLMWTGIYRSTDRGITWESFGDFGPDIDHPSIGSLLELPNGDLLAGHLARGHGCGRGVYRSTDAGYSWSESGYFPPPFLNEIWSLVEATDGLIYCGVATRYDEIVYYSTDNGYSWRSAGPLNGGRETFCLIESSKGTMFAGTSPDGDVYRLRESPLGGPDDGIAHSEGIPVRPSLSQNAPNPFNPGTTIPYSLPAESDVEITVYNLMGQRVKLLVNEDQPAGDYQVHWDGRDQSGEPLASGVYLMRLKAGKTIKTRKLIMVR